ncbi:MAG: NADH-quinone oxidoreductase subunit J [Thiocapsa sp.]|nr:proton-conducting transporter membrane subunit [Thiocapsa sp.]MCG6985294.1 NADH-quinone oxidoreductase subunit J [Thiocapsa sp.]
MEASAIPTAWLAGLSAPGGVLLVVPLILPVVGLLLGLLLGGRRLGPFVFVLLSAGLAAAVVVAAAVVTGGEPMLYQLGGWSPPLGVALKADGLSVVLLLTSAVVTLGVAVYAQRDFRPPGARETRGSLAFWMLLLGVWAGLNTVALGQDLFTLFVALELLTFSAVPLVSLDGRAETLAAALRYLLFALLGSVLYLLGAVLLYGAYGTLDIGLLAVQIAAAHALPPSVLAAAALMTVGLMAKTALVPLHLWLPPAHAGAPPAASAILSALVVKGSFFLLLRIWFDLIPGLLDLPAAQALGVLGAAAILLGNLMALQQARLKLLVAYSTVAQIGYLFLIFPLAGTTSGPTWALSAGTLQVVSHALAKGSLFLAAGLIAKALGHDRIRDLAGVGRVLPITLLASGVAGLSLVGIQPSGGYLVKAALQGAAEAGGTWWWGLVLDAGGLLTAAYLLWFIGHALSGHGPHPATAKAPGRAQELVALALALGSLLLGLLPAQVFELISVGRVPPPEPIATAWAGAFHWGSLAAGLLPLLVVAVLVLAFGPWGGRRRPGPLGWPAVGAAGLGSAVGWLDARLRCWPVAGFSLLALVLTLGVGFAFGARACVT